MQRHVRQMRRRSPKLFLHERKLEDFIFTRLKNRTNFLNYRKFQKKKVILNLDFLEASNSFVTRNRRENAPVLLVVRVCGVEFGERKSESRV